MRNMGLVERLLRADPLVLLKDAGIEHPPSIWANFLSTIHGDAAGIIDLRFIDEDRTRRIEAHSIEQAVNAIGPRLGTNCYVGVSRRRLPAMDFDRIEAKREPDPKKRRKAGGKHNLSQLSALWVDWDFSVDYIDEDDRRGHREEVEIRLEQMAPCPPALVVWSGGGLHSYWIFEEPIDVSAPDAVARVEHTLVGLCDFVGGDRAATDASRILRIPGTLNWPNAVKRKRGRTVQPCMIYKPDDGGRV